MKTTLADLDMADHLGRKAPEAAAHEAVLPLYADGFVVRDQHNSGLFVVEDEGLIPLIVRAVNRDHAFDDLVKALKGLIEAGDYSVGTTYRDELAAIKAARDALAKAGA